ncbi:hypothetical protein QAD02_017544 [Eretmocerus hayati]|uniref:Uncharacterized protein n=1 Tax=Eretmocerus hayati TaxID=131215 RepID=A0ACC2PE81_9HYME|nr:hypothetical protein QAD02_017544 [Eretmocerus hayati]
MTYINIFSVFKVQHHQNVIKLPQHPNCGRSATQFHAVSRMMETQDAAIGEYPWIARLGYDEAGGKNFTCLGSIISEAVIISTASCVGSSEEPGKFVNIARLGDYDLETDPDCAHNVCAEPYADYTISNVTRHEQYSQITRINNIAIVKTDEKIKFNDFIQPICLVIGKTKDFLEKSYIGEKAWIAGWGTWGPYTGGIPMTILQRGEISVLDPSQCQNCRNFMKNLTQGEMCAGTTGGNNRPTACEGNDGGAPLMLQEMNPPRWHLLGMYSCGKCYSYENTYTRISDYSLWILDHI